LFKNFKFKILNEKQGITLVEISVSVFIIAIFSLMVISNFPKIQRQLALSQVAHKIAQDIRRAEDLGFSGAQVSEDFNAKGYGVYVPCNLSTGANYPMFWFIYADSNEPADKRYTGSEDYLVESVNIFGSGVFIKKIYDINNPDANINYLSINFNPPNPDVTIMASYEINQENFIVIERGVRIVMSLIQDRSMEKTVFVNSSGLIEVE